MKLRALIALALLVLACGDRPRPTHSILSGYTEPARLLVKCTDAAPPLSPGMGVYLALGADGQRLHCWPESVEKPREELVPLRVCRQAMEFQEQLLREELGPEQ